MLGLFIFSAFVFIVINFMFGPQVAVTSSVIAYAIFTFASFLALIDGDTKTFMGWVGLTIVYGGLLYHAWKKVQHETEL